MFTNSEINDIDIYFKNKKCLAQFLFEEMSGNWVIAHTDKAFLFKYEQIKIQAIYFKYFDTASDIFNTFDFTVCMGAYDFEKEEFEFDEDFFKHNSQKILKFNANTAYPIVSALRIDKYKKKGYKISKPEFIRVMLTILNTEIKDYASLKEQIGGMYGENYDKILEPLTDDEFDIANIVDKMRDLQSNEKDFDTPFDNEIYDWDDFVLQTLGEKTRYCEHDGRKYRISKGELQEFCEYGKEINFDKYEKVNIKDLVTFPITRYKYVKKENGKYFSFYDSKFEYKIGENVSTDKSFGLYCVKNSSLRSCSYCDEKSGVVLELRIDDIGQIKTFRNLLDSVLTVSEAYVVGEVSNVNDVCKSENRHLLVF